MKKYFRSFVCGLVFVCCAQQMCQMGNAATVDFMPTLQASVGGDNTSGTTRYDSNVLDAAVGVPDASVVSYSDTFFFADSGTGIEYQFDITWTASPTNGDPPEFLDGDNNSLGVGTSGTVQDTEKLLVSVSNLSIGFDNYISGSVAGITNPNLDSASVAFDSVTFADRDFAAQILFLGGPGPGDSLIDLTSNGVTSTFGDDAGEFGTGAGDSTFTFGTDGLTTSESSVLLGFNEDSSVDTDFTLATTTFQVSASFSQAASAVPEPSSFALLGFVTLFGVTRRRRRVDNAQLDTVSDRNETAC